MKKNILIFVLLINYLVSSSQNTIYIGNKSYPATSTWEFAELSLEFGKSTVNTGVLMVTVKEDQFYQQYFGPLLTIYLQNGKQVILNKIANDRVNGYISAAYSVNNINLKLLRNSDIDRIRYTVKTEYGRSNNFLVANEIVEFVEVEVPVPEAKNMSEIDKLRKNIQSRFITNYSPDPFDKFKLNSDIYYYRNETRRISKGIINTSAEISNLY